MSANQQKVCNHLTACLSSFLSNLKREDAQLEICLCHVLCAQHACDGTAHPTACTYARVYDIKAQPR